MPVIQPITSASSGSAYVPTSRILTINGVSYDLTADRSWTVEVLDNLIATAPLSYNSGTNTISISQAGNSSDGYLSSTDWLAFSSKQDFITLTTTGNNGAATLVGATLNIPEYTLAGLGGFSNPMTTLGDMIYGNAIGAAVRRSGNTTTTKMFLSQTGDGTNSAAPVWSAITSSDIGAVPTSRQLTINGTAYDLSADRSWSVGTVTSVAVTMPSAFSVSGSPITSSGTIAITGAGTAAQYVRGDGQLANFPASGGGGSSVNYYLNGSVSQGTFGGVVYYQMSKNAVIGAGTNFTRTNGMGDGYIASFITDAGDPSLLNIPSGNWNLEFYFNTSSAGGTPQFYAELYIVDASNNFTLISSGSTNPETISNGTTVDQYFTSIPVPQTTLLITDRLAVRIYVITSGRSITLHTEDNNLCEILTTFSTGLNALNGLIDQVQFFATGTSGTDFNISSVTDTHTFNLPTASATNRGALSTSDWSTFNGKMNNPFTTLGDTIYSNALGQPVRRSGNITTTKMFLSQTGDGTNSAAPQWSAITSTDTGSVPTSRTLTINDVVFDLTANREWSVGDFGTW
jgi:hypothetical protein